MMRYSRFLVTLFMSLALKYLWFIFCVLLHFCEVCLHGLSFFFSFIVFFLSSFTFLFMGTMSVFIFSSSELSCFTFLILVIHVPRNILNVIALKSL